MLDPDRTRSSVLIKGKKNKPRKKKVNMKYRPRFDKTSSPERNCKIPAGNPIIEIRRKKAPDSRPTQLPFSNRRKGG